MSKKHLLILSGPTAVGKSSLAVQLAKQLNTAIISADSMQIYKEMDIGTAKITEKEKEGIKHYMIDIVEPYENFSVKEYSDMVTKIIENDFDEKQIPIVSGGTGFYINSLIYDMNLDNDANCEPLREYLYQLYKEKGIGHIRDLLKLYDKTSYDRIHINDVKRNIRALEYFILKNKPFSQKLSSLKEKTENYTFSYYVLYKEREQLYRDINKRVDIMLEQGLIEEVKHLKEKGLKEDSQAMQAIGYKEMNRYLKGEWSLETAIEKIKQFSRNYAKRQLTWFRNDPNVKMLNVDDYKTKQEIVNYILREEKANGFL